MILFIAFIYTRSGLQAGRDPKRGVPSLIIVLIFIIIVVGFDIYYAKVIKNYIDTPQNVTPQNYYIENPAQVVYAQNGLNPPNHVTYLQGNNVAQSYTPYQGGVHTGVPVPHQNPAPSHQQEYPVLPPINRNKEMEIEDYNLKNKIKYKLSLVEDLILQVINSCFPSISTDQQ